MGRTHKKNGLPIPTASDRSNSAQTIIEHTIFQSLHRNVGNNISNGAGNDAITATERQMTERDSSIKELIEGHSGNHFVTVAERDGSIKGFMEGSPFITAVQLAETLSVSDRTTERDIAKMQASGKLTRKRDKNRGHRIITKQP